MKKIFSFLGLATLFVTFLPSLTFAHISYVIDETEFAQHAGSDAPSIISVITSSQFIMISVSVLLLAIIVGIIFYKVRPVRNYIKHIGTKLSSYHEFIPWICRLALGIGLIGAGVGGVLISPTLPHMAIYASIQTLLGFFLLAGFALVPTAVATIIVYLIALSKNFYLIGNLDVLGLAIAMLVFHSPRPGVDDILGTSWMRFIKIPRHYLPVIVRFCVGSAMMFLALYEKILNPHISEFVVNKYGLTSVIGVSPMMWVVGAGIVEFCVGLFIFLGVYTRIASIVALLVLSLTFFYFKEAVYSHVTLFSILAITAIEGGGMYSFDRLIFKKGFYKHDTVH